MASSSASAPRDHQPVAACTRPAVRVRGPGDLVAAVPTLIGFHPRDSLVLIGTRGRSGRRLGLTLRVDLPPPADTGPLCAAAAASLLRDAPSGAAVVVVGGGSTGPARADVATAALEALEARGVGVHTAVWAERTAAGARWACFDAGCGCSGVLADPGATPIAAAAVAAGQVLYGDRSDLERLLAPADPQRLRRRERLLGRAVDDALARDDPAGPLRLGAHRALVAAAISDAAAGCLALDDARVLGLVTALGVPAVRDAAMVACAGPDAAGAERLWAALVRETPNPEAAEPAALLAVSALLRGDGALANVALDRAERAWPSHRLTSLLRSVVDVGMRPDRVRATLLGEDAAAAPAPRAVRASRLRPEGGPG